MRKSNPSANRILTRGDPQARVGVAPKKYYNNALKKNADARLKKTPTPYSRPQITTDYTYETENTNADQNEPTLLVLTPTYILLSLS